MSTALSHAILNIRVKEYMNELIWVCLLMESPWEIDGETVEAVSDFIFGGSKITANGDYSHGIKRPLLLGRKVVTNLGSKQRHYFAD